MEKSTFWSYRFNRVKLTKSVVRFSQKTTENFAQLMCIEWAYVRERVRGFSCIHECITNWRRETNAATSWISRCLVLTHKSGSLKQNWIVEYIRTVRAATEREREKTQKLTKLLNVCRLIDGKRDGETRVWLLRVNEHSHLQQEKELFFDRERLANETINFVV